MQVSIETTSGLERRLTIGVPATEVEEAVAERIARAARTVRLNGFRPGRVPVKVVQQRFGGSIRQEVIGETLSRTFQDAVSREGLRLAGPPRIDPLRDEPGQDLEYIAIFEVYPEIQLGDLTTLAVARPPPVSPMPTSMPWSTACASSAPSGRWSNGRPRWAIGW